MGTSSFFGYLMVGLGVLLVGCGGSSKTPPGGSATVCTANERSCDGLNVKVCSADGKEETIESTCLPTQSCSDGQCTETSCVPNTKFCRAGQVFKCDSTGAGSTLTETCDSGQFCLEEDDSADCSDAACTAGQPMCDGDVATVCKADGSGPQAGGTPCDQGQTCYQGACRDSACTEGEKLCQHDDVYLCAANGTDVSLLADCQTGEVCDAAMGACRPKVCEVGKLGCDSTRVVACNEFGSSWEQAGTDCSTDDKICIDGACKKQTCTASASFCQDNNVYQCDGNGTSSTLTQNCAIYNQHCEPYYYGNSASCQYNQCNPGELICDGNYLKTCTDTGSYPVNGTDCGTDKVCINGACKLKVCEPYTYFCKEGDIYYCDYYGDQQASPAQSCLSDTACKQVENGVACVALPCSPGEASCLGNKVGTCAEDGQSLAKVTEDCSTSGSVCGTDAKCAKSVVDTLGVAEDAETISAGNVIGDAVEVQSTRKVTQLEANLVLAAARELRWVIYEQSGSSFIARIDKVVSNQSGTGFFSSGPLNYTLKAGRRYLLGVAITGGNAIAYYDTAPYSLTSSFGSTLGRTYSYYASNIAADYYAEYLYQMRVTTELP